MLGRTRQGVSTIEADTSDGRASGALKALVALIVFSAIGLQLLWPALVDGQVLAAGEWWTRTGPFTEEVRDRAFGGIDAMNDQSRAFIPWLRYAADAWETDGALPLWKSTASCGAPLVGNAQSALFFPSNLAAILLGAPDWIFAAQALLKIIAGMFFAYLLGRHLRLSFLASLLTGLTFGLGGFQMVWNVYVLTNVSFLLPLLILAADRVAQRPGAARLGLLGLVAGLQHLGGHPETAFHCQVGTLVIVAARVAPLGGRLALRRLMTVVVGLGLGALIGAVQILPFLEYIVHSDALHQRGHHTSFPLLKHPWASLLFGVALLGGWYAYRGITRGARGASSLIGWTSLMFLAVGLGLTAGLKAGLSASFMMPIAADWFGDVRHYIGAANYIEANGAYAGAALALAAFGLLYGRPSGPRRVAGVTLALALLVGHRAPLVTDALLALPGFHMAANTRLLLFALLAAAVLAGLALDAMGRTVGRSPRFVLLASVPVLAAWLTLAATPREVFDTLTIPPIRPGARMLDVTLGSQKMADGYWETLAKAYSDRSIRLDDEPLQAVVGSVLLDALPQGARLLYAGRRRITSTILRPSPTPRTDGKRLYGFGALVPRSMLAPGNTRYRLWITFRDGSEGTSVPLAPLESELRDWKSFPATPMPGRGRSQVLWYALAVVALAAFGRLSGVFRGVARLGTGAIVVLSLYPFAADLQPLLAPELLFPQSPTIEKLQRLPPNGRMLGVKPGFTPEFSTAYGIPDVLGYDSLCPQRVAKILRAALDVEGGVAKITRLPTRPDTEIDLVLAGLMSVRALTLFPRARQRNEPSWLNFPRGLPEDEASKKLHRWLVVENPHFLPRARLVSGAEIEPDDERALARLSAPDFSRTDTLLLAEGEPRAARAGRPGPARIVVDRPDRIRIDVEPTGPCWLILSDSHFPGWKAFVDGSERDILRANLAFRAVPLQPGETSVEFRYEPLSVRLGALLSLVGLLILAGALLLSRKPSRAAAPA